LTERERNGGIQKGLRALPADIFVWCWIRPEPLEKSFWRRV